MEQRPRLSVVIPTLNAADRLPATLAAVLRGRAVLDIDLVVADGGSTDATQAVAEQARARLVSAPRGRGPQLASGGRAAIADWLLFLHADTVPESGWAERVAAFIGSEANRGRAGYGVFRLDDAGVSARALERVVSLRCRLLALPYGDQGLLISRDLYDAVGGYRELVLMEDVEIVRRLGRARLVSLPVAMTTSATRYREGGYLRRPVRNLTCLALYFLGVPASRIARFYR
jgi:rSAM/selenodomain-associated transferase 2